MVGRKGKTRNPKRPYSRLPFEQKGELRGAGVPPYPPELHQSGSLTGWQREMRTAWRDYHASSDRALHDLAAGLLHDGGLSPQARWKPPNKEHHAELHRPYRISVDDDEVMWQGEVLSHIDAWARDQGFETEDDYNSVTIEISGATRVILEPSDHIGLDTHKHLGPGALMATIVAEGGPYSREVYILKHFNITSNYLKKVRALVRRAMAANRTLASGSRQQQRRARKKGSSAQLSEKARRAGKAAATTQVHGKAVSDYRRKEAELAAEPFVPAKRPRTMVSQRGKPRPGSWGSTE